MMSKEKIDIRQMARPSIRDLKPYASAKDEFKDFDTDLIYLDANENPYDNGLNRYPDPHQEKLKQKIGVLKGVSVQNILLGNGSDEILDMIFRVFFEPGKDNIIINTPTFGMFQVLANINNVECKKVMLNSNFQLDTRAVKKSVDKNTKAVFICSPNNPTGNLMKEAAVKELLELEILVIIDEAYIDFSDAKSWVKGLENHNNLIVTQTFSKAYGLAGIRLGACFADRRIIDLLKKVKMPYNVSVLTQNKAMEHLENNQLRIQQIDKIIQNRNKLCEELNRITFVNEIFPSDSNFLLVRVDDADRRYEQLIGKELVIRNRNREPLCKNCLRITVGTEEENMALVRRLVQLDKNKKVNS